MKLDEKLARLRKEKGLTQLELAEAVKVSRQAVSKWEAGGAIPTTENLKGLSELLEVPIDYLLNDLDDIETELKGEAFDSHPQGPEDQDTSEISCKGAEKAFPQWGVLALILVILIASIGVVIANKNKERLRLEDVSGEEVAMNPRIEFNLEW